MSTPVSHPTKFGILIWPGFQLLDYAGPLDALHILSQTHPLTLYTISSTLSPISTQIATQTKIGSNFGPTILPTHTFETVPKDLDVLLIPGGFGSREDGDVVALKASADWLSSLGLGKPGGIKWVLTVCTGSELLARTGVLDGRKATTNKRAFNEVKSKHPSVDWVAKARWVVDGNIWTSSGISAGIDLIFAWMAEVFGEEVAQLVADRSEYVRNRDPGNDLYAERWGAV